MVNDETTAGGVGIAIRSRSFMGDFEEVKLSSSTSMGNATQILDIVKDDDIQDTQYILLHAYYRVYDASALSTGTVVATAQIMFGYD
jgi:type 1 fimbria pilin